MTRSDRFAAAALRSAMSLVRRCRDSSTSCSAAAAAPHAPHTAKEAATNTMLERYPEMRMMVGTAPGSIIAAIIAVHIPIASCGSLVFIVAAHPGGPAPALVAPLGHYVEVLVVDVEGLDAARVGRIGAEHPAL